MSDSQEDFEKKLQESKIKYINSLPAKLSEIKLIWNQLNKNAWRAELVKKMQSLAHNLAGSGGTFGFPNLSSQARLLENSLEKFKTSDDVFPNEQEMIKINEILIFLQEAELTTIRENAPMPSLLIRTDVIYILDADREYSLGLSRQLMYYGCSVKIINETSKLEESLRSVSPLIILIDTNFADMQLQTHNVIQTIRKEWLITCPIIYISTTDNFETRITAVRASANAFFTKPVDIPLLIERIQILTNAGIVEPYRILLVEDNEELANYYALVMGKGGMKVFVETKPELALDKILQYNPELIVMDLYMPNYNGIDLINIIRQHQSLLTIPIILLTAEKDVNLQYLAREVGVDDCLLKPITEMHLYDTVLNRVQRSRYMNISMTKDSLTGLFVHKKINDFLDVQLNICRRYNRDLSYIIIDVDNFKSVNDTYGHLVGDNVLVSLANLLKTHARVTDFIGRYGGEEFVIITPETNEVDAFMFIERMRNDFTEVKQYSGNKIFHVSFSAGIASFPKYGDADLLMTMADQALYYAKNNGRNQSKIS